MKDKMKTYSFWISVGGAVILLINNVGKAFGFTIDNKIVSDVINGVCGILVMFGVLTMTTNAKSDNIENDSKTDENDENSQQDTSKNEQNDENSDKNEKSK